MKFTFRTVLHSAILLLLLLCGAAKNSFASHYAAADINVQFDGGADSTKLRYRVTLTLYFACYDRIYQQGSASQPSPAENTATVVWTSALGVGGSRAMTASIRDTVDKLCPNLHLQNACYTPGSIYPGFARRVFTDTITLSSRQPDWNISWNSSARNPNILNINTTAGASSLYVDAGLNNTSKYWDNSTPQFLSLPTPYFCVSQPNAIINEPYDINADLNFNLHPYDSLIVFNLQPRTAANTFIPYNTGYSLANPFGASPNNYSLNPLTGDARFTPPNTGYYVTAFRVESHDVNTGELTGFTTRDVQNAVLACAAPPPAIDSTPINFGGTVIPGNIISICPNQKTTFDFQAKSQSNTNYIYLSADLSKVPGANYTFDTAGGVTTGHFTWTPTTADIGGHSVRFKATDTTCDPSQPILLDKFLTVVIRVLPGLDAGPDQKICPLGDYPIQLNVNSAPNKIYKWYSGTGGVPAYINNRDIPNPVVNPPVDYTYIVRSADPDLVCKNADTVVVRVDRSNGVEVIQNPLVICRPSYITIGADSIGPGPIKNLPCGAFNTISCTTPDQITIGTTGNTGFVRKNTPFFSNYRYHKYQFIIPKSELRNAGLYSGTLRSISFKSNNAILATQPLGAIKVGLACTDRSTYPSAPNNESFELNTTVVASQPSYTITPNGWNTIAFTTPYNWDTTKNLIVDICMGPYNHGPNDTSGYDPVDMTPGQTIQRYSEAIDVCSGSALYTDIVRYTQRPVVRFDYCSAPTLPYSYHWSPGTNLADSTKKYTTAYIPYSVNYAIYTIGKNGCLLRDSLHITVPVYTLDINPNDTAVCVNQEVPLHATGATGYIWYENGFNTPATLSCDNCADPIAIPTTPGDITYTVVFLNPDNCYDTLQQKIHVYAPPNVAIVNSDTTIKYGQSVMLMVNGGNQYTWTPVGSLSDPNIPNPIASPTQSTTYIVYGLDGHHCRSIDSVRINVDFRDNLLIPTGFTPNGDGRNDYFKVVNVTFQKLQEFRVFNRWGQEVFNTTDPTRGWDGKWKGVDQDMGTYKYLIRVAYPDGYTETYKGDVTLIR